MSAHTPQPVRGGEAESADWRAYAALARMAFQRQLAYRFANLSGLLTNGFFGLLRAYVLIALFGARHAGRVAGYSVQDAITYTGLTQALIAYIALWGWWDLMRSIRTGEVASDLSRPLDFFWYWCAQDFGRAAAQLLVRGHRLHPDWPPLGALPPPRPLRARAGDRRYRPADLRGAVVGKAGNDGNRGNYGN